MAERPWPNDASAEGGGPIQARALLLAQRLDPRGLERRASGVAGTITLATAGPGQAYAFRWGAVAMVGVGDAAAAALLERLRPRLADPLPQPVEEVALVAAGAEADGPDAEGVIRLKDLAAPRIALVAECLAKSAALSHQEAQLARTLDRLDPIVSALATRGTLGVSSRALLRSVGEALAARSRAAGRLDPAAKPDLLWDHPELAPLHTRLDEEWELRDRADALERKLGMIQETADALLALVEARRSRGLEVAVVVLIATEVATALYELLQR
jgi:uncharacterized Rmd1/YagE family protein